METSTLKTAFITGGSMGIGLAIAKELTEKNCNIAIFARTLSKLEEAKQLLEKHRKSSDQIIEIFSVDLSDFAAVKSTYETAVQKVDIPDYMINCVGIAQPDHFENITPEIFDKTIKTNLYGTWNSCYAIVPFMKQKPKSVLINTSSIAGFMPVFGYTDYCMTKFGLIGFTESLRFELKKYNINVKVLCPPDTDTPGYEAENLHKPEETNAIAGSVKLVKPEYVAREAIKNLDNNKFMIIPGMDGKFTLLARRFIPGVVTFYMNQVIKKVQSKK